MEKSLGDSGKTFYLLKLPQYRKRIKNLLKSNLELGESQPRKTEIEVCFISLHNEA